VLTDETVAAKLALAAPAGTVTAAGTATAAALLDRLTVWPPAPAAAFSVTVQVSVPAPVIEPFAQLRPLRTGCDKVEGDDVEAAPAEDLLAGNGATHPNKFGKNGKARRGRTIALRPFCLRIGKQDNPKRHLCTVTWRPVDGTHSIRSLPKSEGGFFPGNDFMLQWLPS
jgi:hypothetical protein